MRHANVLHTARVAHDNPLDRKCIYGRSSGTSCAAGRFGLAPAVILAYLENFRSFVVASIVKENLREISAKNIECTPS